jgi:hypothetical protein
MNAKPRANDAVSPSKEKRIVRIAAPPISVLGVFDPTFERKEYGTLFALFFGRGAEHEVL